MFGITCTCFGYYNMSQMLALQVILEVVDKSKRDGWLEIQKNKNGDFIDFDNIPNLLKRY